MSSGERAWVLTEVSPSRTLGDHPKKGLGGKVSKVISGIYKKAWLIKKIILNDIIFCLSLEGKRFNRVISFHHQGWVKYSVMWYPADDMNAHLGIPAWNISPKKIPGIPELRGIPQNWSESFKNINVMKDQGWGAVPNLRRLWGLRTEHRANPESNIVSGNMTKSSVGSTNKICLWTAD